MRTLQQTMVLTLSTMSLGILTTILSVQANAHAFKNPKNSPAARSQSVPPSSDRASAAGPSSASSPRALFVPQIVRYSGEAEPILMVQADYKSKNAMKTPSDINIADIDVAPQNYWAFILGRYINQNVSRLAQFDYAKLKNTSSDLDGLNDYIDYMATQEPSTMSRDDAMAYWANLYNALTVQIVAQNYPVKSIRKIKSGLRAGPWKRKLVTVEDNALSLDNIEHDILRPTYQTPLVHYMVNCASIGCPNLKATPWQGASLVMDQEAAARAYINSPRGVMIVGEHLHVSSIYKWFKADFGGNVDGVLDHLRSYADADLRTILEGRQKIDKYTYDWGINAPK